MFPGVLPLPKGCTTGKPPKGANSSCCASNGWDRQPLGREQLADKDVGALTRRTEAGQNPEWGIYDEGRIYKSYCAQAKSLTTRDSILENHLDSADGIKDGLDSHPQPKHMKYRWRCTEAHPEDILELTRPLIMSGNVTICCTSVTTSRIMSTV